ncbi:MAG: ribosome silencing factor [Saprospiraceae bacterium]|nr:ribosome silencing factor [Saprospiraceae bacterium]
MNTQQVVYKKHSTSAEALNSVIIDAIQDIKGKKIIKLDLRKLHDAPTNYFIICEGDSNVQVRAITDSIYRKVKATFQTTPSHLEGGTQSTWVVMDFFDTVVHIFHRDTRSFYELEQLWSDASTTEYEDLS